LYGQERENLKPYLWLKQNFLVDYGNGMPELRETIAIDVLADDVGIKSGGMRSFRDGYPVKLLNTNGP
jgi:hypothetical protein